MFKKKKANRLNTVALQDKLNNVLKIVQNYQEDYGFVDVLDNFCAGKFEGNESISICKTPNVLSLGGAVLDYDLVINPGTIAKCMSKAAERYHGHDLDRDILKYLVYELRNPIMLLKGSKDNTLVAVTDLRDRQNRPIIVSVALNRIHQHHLTNQITSVYERNNFNDYLHRQVDLGNIIAINKNKANQMFQSAGLHLPLEETPISFDNSISYTIKNVNGFYSKNSKKDNLLLFRRDAEAALGEFDKSLNDIIKKFDKVILKNNEIVEMLKFFEYAGDKIYNSTLWFQFQKDKDYLIYSNEISKLENILFEARERFDSFEHNKSVDKEIDKVI